MLIHFAPMQGYTEDSYRRFHHEIFGGVSDYYTPFIRLEHGEIRSKDIRDIRPEFNENVNIVPQIITNGANEASTLIEKIKDYGYSRIDINMGCPFPLQTRHGRGAGILPHPDKVKEICEVIKGNKDISFSIKMRLGLEDKNEYKQILPILNNTPLKHITIHPRIGKQQYKGETDMESFCEFQELCEHNIIYNGDIKSTEDINRIVSLSNNKLTGIMIGRGLLARPSLAEEFNSKTPLTDSELISKIKLLHDRLYEHFTHIIPGENQQLNKLRTFWDYLEPTIGRKAWKKITKAGNMKNYLIAVNSI